MEGLTVELNNQVVCLGERATILIYDGDKLVRKVEARIVPEVGADGGSYPSIHFYEVALPSDAVP